MTMVSQQNRPRTGDTHHKTSKIEDERKKEALRPLFKTESSMLKILLMIESSYSANINFIKNNFHLISDWSFFIDKTVS